ncbi:hypothetical protein IQ260_14825, partial [Leptolyngbya cf. ectocarpi LEGE 11479]|nr:hypothetical protein [Leptolyngbya cf. ectocarpi LEGE 11479]
MMHVPVWLSPVLAPRFLAPRVLTSMALWLVPTAVLAQGLEPLPPEPVTPLLEPAPLPAPEDLLPQPAVPPGLPDDRLDIPGTFVVSAFRVVGSTVFSESELAAATHD